VELRFVETLHNPVPEDRHGDRAEPVSHQLAIRGVILLDVFLDEPGAGP
jgi:hypothetical protein